MNDHDLKWTMAHEFSFDLIGSPFFLGGGGLKVANRHKCHKDKLTKNKTSILAITERCVQVRENEASCFVMSSNACISVCRSCCVFP